MTTGVVVALDSAAAVANALVAHVTDRRRVGCERLLLAARWAVVHPVRPGEKGQSIGADGTPDVAMFSVEELSCLTEQHRHAAHQLMADALNLQHRHPRLWSRVGAYEVVDWIAIKTARLVAAAGLTLEQARWVDSETAEHITALPVGRYLGLVEAKIIEADQAAAEARREEEMRRLFVRKTRENEHGIKGLYARGRLVEIEHVYATVERIAAILALQGDALDNTPEAADVRRSRAFGLLGSPERVLELFAWAQQHASDPTTPVTPSTAPRPKADLHVHISLEAVKAGLGIARIEGAGPVTLAAMRELLGHTDVTVRPVVDLTANASVDRYEIPTWLKELVRERFPFEVFPYGTTPARKGDIDHSVAYVPISEGGEPGQTNLDNLGPLSRRAHLTKTFGRGWRHIRVGPRSFLWRTPTGYWYRVDPDGTQTLGKEPSRMEQHFKALLYAA